MRRLRLVALALLAGAALMVPQASAADGSAAPAGEARLDALFQDLKRESNERAARRIALRIGENWARSGSATADLLMQWSKAAIEDEKFAVALDFLDQVVTLYPDYAEGWNRRATVHFMRDDYARAMSDIARTLALEPRHFGALSGMARILRETGRKERALAAYRRVLDVYPMMRNAQEAVLKLSNQLDGQNI